MNRLATLRERPAIEPPAELMPVLARLLPELKPRELWLFGSRARGSAGSESDWDLLAALPDEAPDAMVAPEFAWRLTRASDLPITLLLTRLSDLDSLWGRPNTIGYDLASDGLCLRVG